MKEFRLLEGEKIIEEIKPLPALKKYFFFQWLIRLFFFLFVVVYFIFLTIVYGLQFFGVGLIFFLFIYVALAWALSSASYSKFHYWITNKRIITKRGIIGYQIISIPYERISDIIISRTFFENLFGIASLHIQSLAGQMSFQRYSMMGGEGQLFAIPDPEETQNKILQLVKQKRKDEGLTM